MDLEHPCVACWPARGTCQRAARRAWDRYRCTRPSGQLWVELICDEIRLIATTGGRGEKL
jgi:hypothetical protein